MPQFALSAGEVGWVELVLPELSVSRGDVEALECSASLAVFVLSGGRAFEPSWLRIERSEVLDTEDILVLKLISVGFN